MSKIYYLIYDDDMDFRLTDDEELGNEYGVAFFDVSMEYNGTSLIANPIFEILKHLKVEATRKESVEATIRAFVQEKKFGKVRICDHCDKPISEGQEFETAQWDSDYVYYHCNCWQAFLERCHKCKTCDGLILPGDEIADEDCIPNYYCEECFDKEEI